MNPIDLCMYKVAEERNGERTNIEKEFREEGNAGIVNAAEKTNWSAQYLVTMKTSMFVRT